MSERAVRASKTGAIDAVRSLDVEAASPDVAAGDRRDTRCLAALR